MEKTGYELSFEEFHRLLSDPTWRKTIRPLVERWFGAVIDRSDGAISITTAGGPKSVAEVHDEIQRDKRRQYDLYQSTMSLWR